MQPVDQQSVSYEYSRWEIISGLMYGIVPTAETDTVLDAVLVISSIVFETPKSPNLICPFSFKNMFLKI